MAMASPSFLAASPPVRTPDDVMRLRRISPDDSWWRVWQEQVGGAGVEGPRGVRMDTQIAEGQAAIAGLGVAILNPMFWAGEMAASRLVPVIDIEAFDLSDFWLVYPEHRRPARKIRLFRDWLLATVADEAQRAPARFFAPAGLGAVGAD